MNLDCARIVESAVEQFQAGFDCEMEGGRISIVTPYLYPDNGLVEIFVEEVEADQIRVSDLGETLRRLELMGADPLASAKGRFLIDQTVRRLHVLSERGRIEKYGPASEAASLMLDVIAASQAISGLIYTSRAVESASFPSEVALFLKEQEIDAIPRYPVLGESGKKYKVGFRLYFESQNPLEVFLEPLSPPHENGITAQVNRTVRMWVDVNGARSKISLLNDSALEWRAEDVLLLSRLSDVQRWSNRSALLSYFQAFSLGSRG